MTGVLAEQAVGLALGECDVWHVPVRWRSDWQDVLDRDERRRAGTFAVDAARNAFVTSRAAQRLLGERYLGIDAERVTICRDCVHCGAPHGKPRFRDPSATTTPIDYSVSHTDEHLLIAVTRYGQIGVDIDSERSVRSLESLARGALTPGEGELFAGLPRARRKAWFLRAWTRKEAVMKLTGFGLRADPRRLDVRGETAAVGAIPNWPDIPIHLYRLEAPAGHTAALASSVPLSRIRTFDL